MSSYTYSAESMELAGFFSKLKKSVTKRLAKVAPIAPVLSFIPGVGTVAAAAITGAAKYSQAKIAAGKVAAENARIEAENLRIQNAKPAPVRQTYVKYGAPAPVRPATVAPVTAPAESEALVAMRKKLREARKAVAEQQAASTVSPVAPSGASAGGGVVTSTALPAPVEQPGSVEQYKTPLLIGGGLAAALLLLGVMKK